MSSRTSITPPKINVGPLTGLPWFQEGYSYGRNDSGPFQIWITEGRNADVDADALNFHNSSWTYTVTRKKGGISRMEAHAGWKGDGGQNYTTEVLENIWELDPQEIEKGLIDADFPNGSLNSISRDTRHAIKQMLNDDGGSWSADSMDFAGTDITWIFDDGLASTNTADTIHLPSADYATAYSLYLFMKDGISAFPMDASVIRHTQLVSNRYTVKASFDRVGQIISSVSMTSIEGTPADLLFGVPESPGRGAGGTPLTFIEEAGDLQYGWKKARPAVTRLALFKWRIVQHWQFGLWAKKLYGDPI